MRRGRAGCLSSTGERMGCSAPSDSSLILHHPPAHRQREAGAEAAGQRDQLAQACMGEAAAAVGNRPLARGNIATCGRPEVHSTSRTCGLPRCARRRRRCRPLLQLPAAGEAVHRRRHCCAERRAAADLQQHKRADGQQDAGVGRGRQDLAAPAEQHAGDEQAEGDLQRGGEQRGGHGFAATLLQRNKGAARPVPSPLHP